MGRHEVELTMMRREVVRDLPQTAQSVGEPTRGSPSVSLGHRELAEKVAQSPANFSRTRLFRHAKTPQEEFAVIPVINPLSNEDLSNSQSTPELNQESPSTLRPEGNFLNGVQTSARVLLFGSDQLQFDLDPR